MRPAPVAVGDAVLVAGLPIGTVDAVTCRRVRVAGRGWLHRTESGAELRGKLDRRLTVTFGAQSSGA